MYNTAKAPTLLPDWQNKENVYMPYAHYTAEEVTARGEALYEQWYCNLGARALRSMMGSAPGSRGSPQHREGTHAGMV